MTPFDWPRCPLCGTPVLPSERGIVGWLRVSGWWYLVTVHEECDA